MPQNDTCISRIQLCPIRCMPKKIGMTTKARRMDGLRMVKMRSYHFEILYVRKNSDNFRNPAISEEVWTALLGVLIVGRLECGDLILAAGTILVIIQTVYWPFSNLDSLLQNGTIVASSSK